MVTVNAISKYSCATGRVVRYYLRIGHLMGLLARMAEKFALWQTHSNGNPDAHGISQLIDAANEALRLPGYRPTDGAHHV